MGSITNILLITNTILQLLQSFVRKTKKRNVSLKTYWKSNQISQLRI